MSGCTILLDNFLGYCVAGSTLTGKVICTFRKPKSIRGVRIHLKGSEYTAWTEWENYRQNNETKRRAVHYTGENTILAVETTLTGGGDIGPGTFEYPFIFVLPKNLPGTYVGKYGWIKYSIKAVVDRPYQIDYEDKKYLNIIGLIDFNDIVGELLLQPIGYSDSKTLCCCCCKSGPITMNVLLEKEAFVQGETVNVKVDIINASNKDVEAVEVEIKRTTESRVTFPRYKSRWDVERLAFSRETGVAASDERTYSFLMEIPRTVLLSNFSLSTLFSQRSKLKVTAILPFSHSNLTVSSMIVMGHVPVGGHVQNVSFEQIAYLQPYPPPQDEPYPSTLDPYSSNAERLPPDSSNAFYPPGHHDALYLPGVEPPSAPTFEGATAPTISAIVAREEEFQRSMPPSYNEAVGSSK